MRPRALRRLARLVLDLLVASHPAARYLDRVLFARDPFLCVITPVFDPALESLANLVDDLRRQRFGSFVHVSISNGSSPRIRRYIDELRRTDRRFVYDEADFQPADDHRELMADLGRRRDRALKTHAARRYVFLDADVRVVDPDYLAKLYVAHTVTRRPILVTQSRRQSGVILPQHPIAFGRIDMANFSFSRRIARGYEYPRDCSEAYRNGNDYRFWERITADNRVAFLDFVATEERSNRGYRRVTDRMLEEVYRREGRMIPVFGNSFTDADVQGVRSVLGSHLVGHGAEVERFEDAFRQRIGFDHAVATNSCTNAFWVLLRALDLPPGADVLVPNIHYFGIRGVLELLRLRCRVVDVADEVPNVGVDELEAALSPDTRAIILLDYGGYPADVRGVRSILHARGRSDVRLILDAANSPFTKAGGDFVARGYDFAVYSFDMNKILVTGEGGMVLSNDGRTMARVRELSYLGITGSPRTGFAKAQAGGRWWETTVGTPSLKLAMNNIAASLGLSQLGGVDRVLRARALVKQSYVTKLSQVVARGLVTLPPGRPGVENDTYLFWLKLRDEATRDGLARHLLAKRVYSTVKYEPLDRSAATPRAFDFYRRALCIPLNQNLSEDEVDYVVSQIFGFFEPA